MEDKSKTYESFKDFGLSEDLLLAIEKKGYTTPTEIQSLVIPIALSTDKDIIAQAKTGTGKTAAFGIPILQRVEFRKSKAPKVLIITPTRELALQISDELKSLRGSRRIRISTVYGGHSIVDQLKDMEKGIDIVVGTPGRLLDHLNRESLDLSSIEYLVLDEADRMLDMGFIDDIMEIINKLPKERRTFLFSATMPREIVNIAEKFMKEYEHISTVTYELTTENAEQIYFEVEEGDKLSLLCRIIDMAPDFYGLIFCQTKLEVDEVSKKLSELGYNADGFHGDYSQYQRERVLDKFKKKNLRILVTTDVAARGIDIDGLTHVINYSVPRDPEYYVHRIGRTGRAGQKGFAITFVTRDDYFHFARVKKFAKARISKEKIPQVEDIMQKQLENLVKDITSIPHVSNELYRNVAKELIEKMGPTEAVQVLIHALLKERIDVNRYGELVQRDFSKESSHNNRNDSVRLFVGMGTAKGIDKKKLIEYISEKTGIEQRNIQNVRVYENFSFIDVNEFDAQIILKLLNPRDRRGRKGKPLVERAREKKSERTQKANV